MESIEEDQETLIPQKPSPSLDKYGSDMLNVYTRGYRHIAPFHGVSLDYNMPIFSRYYVPAMQRDPHLSFGMWILRGPIISKTKYNVISDNPQVKLFVERQLKRFYMGGLSQILEAMDWGWNGSEVIYKFNKKLGLMEYDSIKFVHSLNSKPVIKNGCYIGMKVSGVKPKKSSRESQIFIPSIKSLWTVHQKRSHRWFGESRYKGAFIPWYETWQPKGFRAIRHMALYKYAFDGGVLKYPYPGAIQDEVSGQSIPNVRIAQQLLDMREAGAGLALPSSNTEYGGWDYDPPSAPGIPETLFTYGYDLRDEKWEGLGVPPEIAKQEATGSFAGRRVPQQAFYAGVQEIADEFIPDAFKTQCLDWLVSLNYGPDEHYELETVSILKTLQEEEMGAVTGKLPGSEDEDQLSNGRVEDRDSNAYNIAEKSVAANG